MGDALQRRIKQTRFDSSTHEALLNLIVSSAFVREIGERTLDPFDLTLPQYNVLRILRAVHPDGHPRCEIAARMIDRAPDVTRLIDRLVEKGLVERDREGNDRRHSIARITQKGVALLAELEPLMGGSMSRVTSRLSERDASELSRICELLYDEA